MRGFLEYVPGTSLLHRMNPVAKLVCSLLVMDPARAAKGGAAR